MNNRIYITTTIPYVNAQPHIGFALELVQADVIARYNRLGGNRTQFQTGTDENALKNVLAAREKGITTQKLVDKNSGLFRNLGHRLSVSPDNFVRTTEDRHRESVERFWNQLHKDDVYIQAYSGLYCTGCEDFYLEKDLIDGRCPDHGTHPVRVAERNYFFRLSTYQDRLEKLISEEIIKIIPDTRKNEILRFISRGLRDISISRSAERFHGWGIRVPGDPSQVIYVWIDALINYLSGLGYGDKGNWADFWNENALKIHVIGKNVWKFHSVYWPALLLSAGLPLPNEIFVHGFLTENGQKISKSRGSPVDPFIYIDRYGPDAVRYYLLRAVSPCEDGDFSSERLVLLYNSDLANNLGNLLSRVTTLCEKGNYGSFKYADIPHAPGGYHAALSSYEFDKALKVLWSVISQINQDIDRVQPWKALKAGNLHLLRNQLSAWLDDVHRVAYWLTPFLPDTGKNIIDILSAVPITASVPLVPRLT